MSSNQEKLLFSERLKQILTQHHYPISPTYIANEFNLRYDGQPISVQSANNWLQAKAIPNQDKLSLLATWLGVSTQWLRFGEEFNHHDASFLSTPSSQDLVLLAKFNQLNSQQKKIMTLLLDELITS